MRSNLMVSIKHWLCERPFPLSLSHSLLLSPFILCSVLPSLNSSHQTEQINFPHCSISNIISNFQPKKHRLGEVSSNESSDKLFRTFPRLFLTQQKWSNSKRSTMSMFSGFTNQISGWVANKTGAGAPAEGEDPNAQMAPENGAEMMGEECNVGGEQVVIDVPDVASHHVIILGIAVTLIE